MGNCFICSLKPVDIQFMKELHHLVNIIPVIAKADTLTPTEVRKLKLRVRKWFCTYMHLYQ